ncbi:hypothetical protein FRC16_000728 [Serendipita sp. 398]|nr:hypothetical protein FRC16_000728 [Serendipita sp. 398]
MSRVWLPPELWKEIFSQATYVGGEHSIREWIQYSATDQAKSKEEIDLELARQSLSNDESNPFMLLENNSFHDQIALRLSLILVCKDWQLMAQEYLYGSIIIRRPSRISGCLAALKRSEHLRRSVRRIEFKLFEDDRDMGDVRAIDTFQRNMVKILEICSEVLIFRGSLEYYDGRIFDQVDLAFRIALAEHCPNLQLAVGHKALDGYPAIGIFRYIPLFTDLFILQLPPNIATVAPEHKPAVSLPNLRILDFGNQAPLISVEFGRYLARWVLPALDTVHLGTISATMHLEAFWASHGSKLKTIKVYNAQGFTMGRRLSNINLGITVPSNTLFPNLHQLILLHNGPSNLIYRFLPSSSLKIYEVPLHEHWPDGNAALMLHVREQLSTDHMEPLLRASMCPSLQTIYISNCPQGGGDLLGVNWAVIQSSKYNLWKDLFAAREVKLDKIYRNTSYV